ncbi:MAG: hypothetical protein ACXWQR_16740, partial [Ktedonobacterales bacterium]
TAAAAQADFVALTGEIDELLRRAGLWNADQIYELSTSRGPSGVTDQNTVPDAPADTQQESSSKSISANQT